MEEQDEWLMALREACTESSQSAVARRLGVSPSLVNQVLKGVYKGDIERIRTLVEGALMAQVVNCPVMGDLAKDKCLENQSRPLRNAVVNPLFSRLYRACRSGCPHSKLPKEY